MTIILFVAFLVLLTISQELDGSQCALQYHSHNQCQNYELIREILHKLKIKFEKSGKVIRYVQNIVEESNPRQMQSMNVYPSIIIKNSERKLIRYQNQLSLVELQYWTNIYCFQEIPKCSSWMPQPIFPVTSLKYNCKAFQELLQFIVSNPVIKICSDQEVKVEEKDTSEYYSSVIATVEGLLSELPIIYKFTHNTRDFLLKNSHRTVVLIVYNPKVSSHSLLKDKFLELINFVRKKDQRISYQISEQAKKSLVFVIDRYSSKMIVKLLQFLQIAKVMDKESPLILSLRFKENKKQKELVHSQYQIPAGQVLDNKFLYWLDQIGRAHKKKQVFQKVYYPSLLKFCEKSYIRNTYSDNDFKSIVNSIKFLKFASIFTQDDDFMSEELGKTLFSQVLKITNETNWKNNTQAVQSIKKEIDVILDGPETHLAREKANIAIKIQKNPYIQKNNFFLCVKDNKEIQTQSLEELQSKLENIGLVYRKDMNSFQQPREKEKSKL